ncbi:hypothetical protein PI124_g17938 [Phytophthora idaei]|nr:hypothetical protein PI125_g11662 [Phytophthora idaei]KAG3151140.1 hypothetical protein PI126_g11151 [Phytophthora idaei]KAG3237069.1 hypothetical protein PI124_g17938 [Phytophthora idaei]
MLESEEEFDLNQTKIMRIIGMSVPSEILHQIRDKTTGTEMWAALRDLFENKANKTVKAHTIRRLRNEFWSMKLAVGGNTNLHLSKMFNIRTELETLQYSVDDLNMVEALLVSLPNQPEFKRMKSSILYAADSSLFTPAKVRELIREAASRQSELGGKGGGGQRGGHKGGGNHGGGSGSKAENPQSEKSSDFKKKNKLKKCYICGSAEHLNAECPEKVERSNSARANEKRKPHGNVTLRQENRASPSPDHEDEDIGVVAGTLDRMMIDAGVDTDIRDLANLQSEVVDTEDGDVNNDRDGMLGDTTSGWWFFDTAANVHVTGNRAYFYAFTEDTSQSQSVHGVTPTLASRIAGVGKVALVTEVDG